MATTLKELIEDIEKDDLPTNEFTIEDEDPMVILGKINEVIASLKMIQDTISSSDTKAQEALTTAIQALDTANQALSSSNISLETANQAIATANQAIATANTALQESQNAIDTSNQANNTANTAETNSLEAIRIAQETLDQVTQDLGTKAYINNVLQNRLDFTEDPQTQINNILSQVETNTSDISTITADVEELGNELNTTNANLNTEATARQSADTTLQNNIDSEASARESADNGLQNNINTEASARESADTTLQTQIDTLNNISETIVAKGTKEGVNYIKYNSGILICWGTTTPSSIGTPIILPVPFVNTKYSVGATNKTIQNNQIRALATTNYTTTSFRTWGQYSQSNSGYTDGDVTYSWIAIGFWK